MASIKQLRKNRDNELELAQQFNQAGSKKFALIHKDRAVRYEAQALRQERIQRLQKFNPKGISDMEKGK